VAIEKLITMTVEQIAEKINWDNHPHAQFVLVETETMKVVASADDTPYLIDIQEKNTKKNLIIIPKKKED
jgi:hypothetical protein